MDNVGLLRLLDEKESKALLVGLLEYSQIIALSVLIIISIYI